VNQNKIANIFNNYFISTADTVNSHNNKHINTSTTNPINCLTNNFKRLFPKISWQYAYTYKNEKIVKSLSTTNTCGCDEITNHIIKLTAPFIIAPLTHICNAVLQYRCFCW